jgi:hypothetical protein
MATSLQIREAAQTVDFDAYHRKWDHMILENALNTFQRLYENNGSDFSKWICSNKIPEGTSKNLARAVAFLRNYSAHIRFDKVTNGDDLAHLNREVLGLMQNILLATFHVMKIPPEDQSVLLRIYLGEGAVKLLEDVLESLPFVYSFPSLFLKEYVDFNKDNWYSKELVQKSVEKGSFSTEDVDKRLINLLKTTLIKLYDYKLFISFDKYYEVKAVRALKACRELPDTILPPQ